MAPHIKKTLKKLKNSRGKSMRKRNQKMNKRFLGGEEGDMAEVVYYDGSNYNALRSSAGQSVSITTAVISNDKIKKIYKDISISNSNIQKLCKATEVNLLKKFNPPGPSTYYGPRTFGSKIRAKEMAQYIDASPSEFEEVTPEAGNCYIVYYSQ